MSLKPFALIAPDACVVACGYRLYSEIISRSHLLIRHALHLTKLLMGWTNVVPVFHNDVMHILQLEVPQLTIPYIDDVPVCRPATTYQNGNRVFETILENSSIHHFIWEHFQNLNCIVQ